MDTLTLKDLKNGFTPCFFDQEESPKTGLRQWQHVLELEDYIINVGCVSNGTLGGGICVKHFLGRGGGKLWITSLGEKVIWGEHNIGGVF